MPSSTREWYSPAISGIDVFHKAVGERSFFATPRLRDKERDEGFVFDTFVSFWPVLSTLGPVAMKGSRAVKDQLSDVQT